MGREFPLAEIAPLDGVLQRRSRDRHGLGGVPGAGARRRVTVEPYDTPFGRITVVEDHAGMAFSVIDQSRVIEAEPRTEVDDPFDD